MDFGRVHHDGSELWVRVEDGEVIPLPGPPWECAEPALFAQPLDPAQFSWLPPVRPGKILALGRTFAEHARERGVEPPRQPMLFLKPPSCVLGHGGDVVLPRESAHVEHEGELALVVSRRIRRFPADGDVASVVFGCLVADDVSARDLQKSDGQWARAKGFDTFCPIGPLLRSGLADPGARLRTTVNGEPRQDESLAAMSFSLGALLAFASSAMTLEPGDLVLTGTPRGVGRLAPGDAVRIEVDGLPALEHGVRGEVS